MKCKNKNNISLRCLQRTDGNALKTGKSINRCQMLYHQVFHNCTQKFHKNLFILTNSTCCFPDQSCLSQDENLSSIIFFQQFSVDFFRFLFTTFNGSHLPRPSSCHFKEFLSRYIVIIFSYDISNPYLIFIQITYLHIAENSYF